MAGSIKPTMLNQGGADPIQGYDVGVWIHDQGTNGKVLLGQFTSIVITVRNATEVYLEMGQRYPRYLDGEFQIAFVLEKGLLDINVFQQTFGFSQLSRRKRFGRSPRFEITFTMNPVDADVLEASINDLSSTNISRDVTGRFVLETAKVDSWHIAATSGRHVVATQWQGIAEGMSAISSDFSQIEGLKTPGLTQTAGIGGYTSGNYFRSFQDGVASTVPGTQSIQAPNNGTV